MTALVAFLCTDGVVVAADSMIAPSIGGVYVGHHKGLKVEVISGPQVFAFAGNQNHAARFKIMADVNHASLFMEDDISQPIDYPVALIEAMIAHFSRTGLDLDALDITPVLAYIHKGTPQCCVFEGPIQPRLLDRHHFYVALGIGKQSADPFLRFLVDVFCPNGQPNVREAVFLATWTLDHVIKTSPGGIAEPIKIAVFESDTNGAYSARSLPETDIEEHLQAVESAEEALRQWRDAMLSGKAAEDVPAAPAASTEI